VHKLLSHILLSKINKPKDLLGCSLSPCACLLSARPSYCARVWKLSTEAFDAVPPTSVSHTYDTHCGYFLGQVSRAAPLHLTPRFVSQYVLWPPCHYVHKIVVSSSLLRRSHAVLAMVQPTTLPFTLHTSSSGVTAHRRHAYLPDSGRHYPQSHLSYMYRIARILDISDTATLFSTHAPKPCLPPTRTHQYYRY
jgi:hypothetical protein